MAFEVFEKLPAEKQEVIISTGIRAFSLKPYKEVSTDIITKQCQISKGILFHYFGSKKEYYLYCLNKALECLTESTEEICADNFYDILFAEMERKMAVCTKYRDEMHMVNMASRDASAEISIEKAELIGRYKETVHEQSRITLKKALGTLKLKNNENTEMTITGLHLYINAVLNRYLLQYQKEPDRFFEDKEQIRKEMKQYLDLMLYGICQKEIS